MADDHRDDARETEASLELPSFGLRRKQRKQRPAPADPADLHDADADPADLRDADADPAGRREPEAAPETEMLPAATEHPEPTEQLAPVEPAGPAEPVRREPSPAAAGPPAPAPPAPAPEPVAEQAPEPRRTTRRPAAVPAGPHGWDDYDDEAPGRPPATADTGPGPGPAGGVTAGSTPARARPSLTGLTDRLPRLSEAAAVLVTGVVVGLVGVLLTLASMTGCEALRGTSSCGGAGFFLLAAVLLGMALLGGALLAAWHVRDPGSTSVLAVGLVTVIALTFLVEVILSWAMVVVVPLVAMAAYGVSHRVTTMVADAGDD